MSTTQTCRSSSADWTAGMVGDNVADSNVLRCLRRCSNDRGLTDECNVRAFFRYCAADRTARRLFASSVNDSDQGLLYLLCDRFQLRTTEQAQDVCWFQCGDHNFLTLFVDRDATGERV